MNADGKQEMDGDPNQSPDDSKILAEPKSKSIAKRRDEKKANAPSDAKSVASNRTGRKNFHKYFHHADIKC